jgi:hypothetical protein
MTLCLAGTAVVNRTMASAPALVRLSGGLLAGVVSAAWLTYVVAAGLSGVTGESLTAGLIVASVVNGGVAVWLRDWLRPSRLRLSAVDVLFLGAALVFSFWLMDNRLFVAGDVNGDPLMVSSETWGDTALHVALSRSFSEGANYPTEYPFFANEAIRYHFGYDFFAGALQEGGLSVALSFNLPGALGFSAMMALLFSLGRMLFSVGDGGQRTWWRDRGVWVGLIAVALLMTNQSMEFIRYFERTGSLADALDPNNWWNLGMRPQWSQGYLSIGPYTDDKIAIFNTLNVFLTQTHLIIAMGMVLFVSFGLLQPLRFGQPLPQQRMLLLGLVFGLSFWLNGVLFIAAGVFFGALLVVFAGADVYRAVRRDDAVAGWAALKPWLRQGAWFVGPALALAIPQALWLNGGAGNDGAFRMHLGYLVCSSPNSECHAAGEMDLLEPSHWYEFVNYWLLNQGLMFPLLIVALVVATRNDLKILGAVMVVFVLGSLFQLSRDLGGHNHKIFNLWEIMASLFVANAVVVIAEAGRDLAARLSLAPAARYAAWGVAGCAFFVLVLSGLLDFMTIKNDWEVEVFGENQPVVKWIEDSTDGEAVFMTAWGDLYTAPTLAGRRVFLGYDPWASSAGYDVSPRQQAIAAVYGAADKTTACGLLVENNIDYLLIGASERGGQRFTLNEELFKNEFALVGSLPQGSGTVDVYDVRVSCAAA